MTVRVPLPLVELTTVSAVQAPHVELSVESQYWISYAEIVLPEPEAAPLQESVTLPSDKVVLTEHAVGAPQAVIAQRTLLLSLNAEAQLSVSVTLIWYLVYVPCV